MATITIQNPLPGRVFVAGEPVNVVGIVVGDGSLEPSAADTVTVAVDGGTPVNARVSLVPPHRGPGRKPPPTSKFWAVAPVPDALGLYTLTVDAMMDNNKHFRAGVTILRGDAAASALTPPGSLAVPRTHPATP